MSNEKFEIGQVLSQDNGTIDHEIKVWRNTLFPNINAAVEQYKAFSRQPFTNELLALLIEGNFKMLEQKAIDANVTKGMSPVVINRVKEDVKHEILKLQDMWHKVETAKQILRPAYSKIILNWNHVKVVDEVLQLDVEGITDYHTVKIESEEHIKILNKVSAVVDELNELVAISEANGWQYDYVGNLGTTLINVSDENKFSMSEDVLRFFKN